MTVISLNRVLFAVCFIYSQLVLSQNIDFKIANFRFDKDGLKNAQKNVKLGDEFRSNALKNALIMQNVMVNAEKAYYHYKTAHNFNPNNAILNYKIASVLLFTNRKEFAKLYLDNALLLSSEFPDEFYFFKGMVLQLDERYEDAIESYQYFQDNAKKKVVEKYSVLLKKYIDECTTAPDLLASEKKVWIDNLSINSEYDDWSPCLSADGELLIFTSNRKNENIINDFGFYDQDIYYSKLSGRNFKNVSSLSELNTARDDVSGGLSYDGQRLLIYKEEDGNTDVFESKLNGKYWTQANRKLGEKLRGGNTDRDETFASYDPPDIKIYYITNGGYSGNKDIYFSGVMNRERNIWGKGQSAGVINTPYEEGSVYIHPDGRTMYFSSKGHNSLGGYDIFVSYVDELGHKRS